MWNFIQETRQGGHSIHHEALLTQAHYCPHEVQGPRRPVPALASTKLLTVPVPLLNMEVQPQEALITQSLP
jgi:hypothetical protein